MSTERGILDRNVIQRARPIAKGILALLLWSNSAVTTILCCQWAEQQITRTTTPASWAIGLAITVILTVAQIFTKDADGLWYLVSLVPDVATTAAQHQRWLVPVLSVLFGGLAGMLSGWTIALLLGWFSARLPERLMFGRVYLERQQTA